ncbi:related to alcohol oxidase [Cephalotrichum gorgonifer]|uniref:Related to alcohol oxidase n=1 Tax=Cephalotrichum gorgonifer TaxID=2041049 RepID=A0AAE8MUA0_9PEZI|nr:related to alcohol oxidase [Cephalotrichum gorgonifer]
MTSPAKLALAAISLSRLVASSPLRADSAVIIKRQAELRDEYDFIVAGAGTAGLTVADRLSEGGQYTVLVVEYGYLDGSHDITATGPDAREPFVPEYRSGTRMYNITSAPLVHTTGRPANVACGCVVGGSSAVNGMFFDRGSAEDYDSWVWAAGEDHEAEYAREWGWDNIYPFFQKSVTFHPPDERMQEEYKMTYDMAAWGGDTPIHASYPPFQWPGTVAVWDAWRTIEGVEFPKEHGDGNATGLIWCPNSIDPSDRTRSYSRRGHYDNGANERTNFHLLPAHRATKVVLEEVEGAEDRTHRAVGVHIAPRDGDMWEDGPRLVRARREVVVSAGSVHTPQVLQRSGVGPRDVLEAAGVEVKVELPGVGFNLQDHAHYTISFNYTTDLTPNPGSLASDPEFRAEADRQWAENKSGPHSSNVNGGAFLPLPFLSNRSEAIIESYLAQDPAEFLPSNAHETVIAGYKQQMKTMARMFASNRSAELEWLVSGRGGSSIIMIKIVSRGTILISPEDDGDSRGNVEPVVDWRTFSNPIDAEITAEFLKLARWFMQTEAMQKTFAPVEVSPGVDIATDEEIIAWIKSRISPSNGHLVGTASLGPKELGGVVGPDLRVHGIEGLSVADNSIMRIIPGTHTSSTAYAIGEKAADLVLRRAKANPLPETDPVELPVEEDPAEEDNGE